VCEDSQSADATAVREKIHSNLKHASLAEAFGVGIELIENKDHGSTTDLAVIVPFRRAFLGRGTHDRKNLATTRTHDIVHLHKNTMAQVVIFSTLALTVGKKNPKTTRETLVSQKTTHTTTHVMKLRTIIALAALPLIAAACKPKEEAPAAPAAPAAEAPAKEEAAPAAPAAPAPAEAAPTAPAAAPEAAAAAPAPVEAAVKAVEAEAEKAQDAAEAVKDAAEAVKGAGDQ
jgi:hypothetical protein